MNENDETLPDADDVEHLLPWFAAGRLGARDRSRVEGEFARDEGLARRLALAQEEMDAAVRLNEGLGAPLRHTAEDLFRRIDAEPLDLRARLAGTLQSWRTGLVRPAPRTLAWATGLVAVVIVAQAGIIGNMLWRSGGATYETASGPRDESVPGTMALVGFAPDATAAQITTALDTLGMSIVDGPHGGLYRVRLGAAKLPREATDALLGKLRAQRSVVLFAMPGS